MSTIRTGYPIADDETSLHKLWERIYQSIAIKPLTAYLLYFASVCTIAGCVFLSETPDYYMTASITALIAAIIGAFYALPFTTARDEFNPWSFMGMASLFLGVGMVVSMSKPMTIDSPSHLAAFNKHHIQSISFKELKKVDANQQVYFEFVPLVTYKNQSQELIYKCQQPATSATFHRDVVVFLDGNSVAVQGHKKSNTDTKPDLIAGVNSMISCVLR